MISREFRQNIAYRQNNLKERGLTMLSEEIGFKCIVSTLLNYRYNGQILALSCGKIKKYWLEM